MTSFTEFQHFNRIKTITAIYGKWLKRNTKVLDVGCGDGIIANSLSQNLQISVHGCDVEKYLDKDIPFTLMEIENKLPFPNNSFDSVIFTDVLHHVLFSVQEDLITEALRVCKYQIIINELKPTAGAYIEDLFCNKIIHPTMKIPYTFRDKISWISLFRKHQLDVEFIDIPRPAISLVSHVVFRLKK